jgi:hypothetical protein
MQFEDWKAKVLAGEYKSPLGAQRAIGPGNFSEEEKESAKIVLKEYYGADYAKREPRKVARKAKAEKKPRAAKTAGAKRAKAAPAAVPARKGGRRAAKAPPAAAAPTRTAPPTTSSAVTKEAALATVQSLRDIDDLVGRGVLPEAKAASLRDAILRLAPGSRR